MALPQAQVHQRPGPLQLRAGSIQFLPLRAAA